MRMRSLELTGVMEKINRAIEHHDNLQHAATSWVMENPYDLVDVRTDRKTSSYVLTGKRTSTPPRISSIFGDLVHNVRSSLDYLARQLLIANDGVPNDGPGGTAFPILDRARSIRIMAARGTISEDAQTILDAVQPYHWGEKASSHPLARLNRLDNIDKHRLLHATVLRGKGHVSFLAADDERMVMPDANVYDVHFGEQPAPQVVAVAPEDLYDNPKAHGSWSLRLVLSEDDEAAGEPLDALGAQLIIHVAGAVIYRFMDSIGPLRVADLDAAIIRHGGLPPGSFQDEIMNAARGWGEPGPALK